MRMYKNHRCVRSSSIVIDIRIRILLHFLQLDIVVLLNKAWAWGCGWSLSNGGVRKRVSARPYYLARFWEQFTTFMRRHLSQVTVLFGSDSKQQPPWDGTKFHLNSISILSCNVLRAVNSSGGPRFESRLGGICWFFCHHTHKNKPWSFRSTSS